MTSRHHGPCARASTRAAIAGTKGRTGGGERGTQHPGLSPEWRLQINSIKWELLVSADQHAAVDAVPGVVRKARRTTTGSWRRSN